MVSSKLFLVPWLLVASSFLQSALCQGTSPSNLERTRSLALLIFSLQCISETDEATGRIREINSNFSPESHLNEYQNPPDVERLLAYVNRTGRTPGNRNDDPVTNSPEHISQLTLILNVLYPNALNWPLFYNTSVWLIDRVNSAQLFWSLMVVTGEKYSGSLVIPSTVEVYPQLYINKREVAKVVEGLNLPESSQENHTLQYWTGDPGLNEFHTHWHNDNPFWWNARKYGVPRDRRGELFLYMHHQIVARYQSELLSNGLGDVEPLGLDPDYVFPEPYYPDIINANYMMFFSRREGAKMRVLDDGKSLRDLRTWYDRLQRGIEQGGLMRKDGSQESLQYENGTDILGNSVEASTVYAVSSEYYGSFHNLLHRYLGGLPRPQGSTPGVEAHSETAMRDPVFYRLHKLVDTLYLKLKSGEAPYTKNDLDYPGVQIKLVEVQTPQQSQRWHLIPPPPTLTTYFTLDKYDISLAARPCRGVGDPPIFTRVKILDHHPFTYQIGLKSTKNTVAHGMVRIFLLPEHAVDGRKLDQEEAHQRAIQLDSFRVQLPPNKDVTISRSSSESSVCRKGPHPGIKPLYEISSTSGQELLRPELRRACGWPQNLLIPKGTADGLKFKMVVMVSEEPEPKEGEDYYPNYPYCGALNGVPYPDRRAMGFPFDRPGTRFVSYDGIWGVLGGYAYKNVKQFPITIKHQEKAHAKVNSYLDK